MIIVSSNNNYQVSIIVATYNPIWIELKRTLLSVLLQKCVCFEIVIADDGSRKTFRENIKLLFQQHHFDAYKIVNNLQNQGTVENVRTGVKVATGKYIKLISPGDFLYGEKTLYDFVDFMERTGTKLSFGRAVYYNFDAHGKLNIVKQKANPSTPSAYTLEAPISVEKFYYLIKNDLVLGAATIVERYLLDKYLDLISGKVIYAEDNCYRLMVAAGNRIVFFDSVMIFYEYGSGVSTNGNSVWTERLKKDWHATDKLICAQLNIEDSFDKKLKVCLEVADNKKRWLKRLLFAPYYFEFEKKEYTVCDPDFSFFNKIAGV